jgi:hypothetical protein
MTFARLRAADWVAFLAALALLFVTAMDWYSTTTGDEARRIEQISEPQGAEGGQVEREVQEQARITAEGAEKNAWQADDGIDRVILLGLLATVVLGVLGAFARAADRGRALTGLAGLAGAATALLVAYRLLQQPGLDEATTVKAGAPVGLAVLGVVALACAAALRSGERAEAKAA